MRSLLAIAVAAGCGSLDAYPPPDPPVETGTPAPTPPDDTDPDPIDTAPPVETADSADVVDTDTGADTVPVKDPELGDPALLCTLDLACDQAIVDEPKVPCTLAITSGDGVLMYDGRADVELRGRSSLGFPKPQYSVELREAGSLVLLPADATWRYLDTGVDPGPSWAAAGFNDSAWATGAAPLGYGDAQTTVLSYGPDADNKQITAYFRVKFAVKDPASLPPLVLALSRDDGAVVYLNGVEVRRDNLPEGSITAATLATATVGGADETALFETPLPADALLDGDNVLAVEVHQAAPNSSDLTLAAEIREETREVEVDLFGFGSDSDWILDGMYVDRALLRTAFATDNFAAMSADNYGPDSAYCDATLNGAPVGVYRVTERVKRNPDRVDLPADPGDGTSFLVKLDDEPGLVDNLDGYGTWQAVYPRDEDLTDVQRDGIVSWLEAWQAAYRGGDPADPAVGIFTWLDLDSAVDLVITEELSRNVDAYYLSLYLYKEPGGKMKFVPWDVDLSLGQPSYSDNENPQGFVGYRPPFIAAMGDVPAFRERLPERWAALRKGPLSDAALDARLDAYVARTGKAAYTNFEIWPIETIEFGWSGENYLYPVSGYDEELLLVRGWLAARVAWLDANISTW